MSYLTIDQDPLLNQETSDADSSRASKRGARKRVKKGAKQLMRSKELDLNPWAEGQ